MSNTMFVRLKPYNKRKGHLVRNYTVGGVKFTDAWKEVSRAKAHELSALCQPRNADSDIPLFDIVSREQAEQIEAREKDDGKRTSKVREAERLPDRSFRDDRPVVQADGTITAPVVEVDDLDDVLPPISSDDDFGPDPEGVADPSKAPEAAPAKLVAPAPSLRPKETKPAPKKQ